MQQPIKSDNDLAMQRKRSSNNSKWQTITIKQNCKIRHMKMTITIQFDSTMQQSLEGKIENEE